MPVVSGLFLWALWAVPACWIFVASAAPAAPYPYKEGEVLLPSRDAKREPTGLLAEAGHLVTRSGTAMGTAVQIRVYSDGRRDDGEIEQVIDRAFAELRRLEALMTTWRAESDISRVNAAAGQGPVAVSKEVLDVVRRSLDFSRMSGGAFDISYYALRGLWKFDDDLTAVVPDPKAVAARIKLIDWRKIQVDQGRRTIFLQRPGMAVNLGGIGKGFAVDAAVAVLRQGGFPDAVVQAGGDLMLAGSKAGKPWMAGVRDPRGPADDYFAVCPVLDHAFSTAGDYERGFVLDGRRYHHIIDPKTGYPATRARSVTIYARDATTADGLDDAVLIMGPEAGLKLIESIPGAGAIIVDNDNKVYVSNRIKDLVKIVHPPTPGI